MSYLLDTNSVIDHFRRGPASNVTIKLSAAPAGSVYICSVVLAELIDGAMHGQASHHETGTEGSVGILVNLISIRFWTFALAFFGLTGVLFEGLDLGHGTNVLALAIVLGATIGFFASWLVRQLRGQVVTSASTELGFVGLTGEVLLEVTKEEPGRIRISARGSLVDLPARTSSARLERGARALVLDVQDGVASVSRAPDTKEKGRNT